LTFTRSRVGGRRGLVVVERIVAEDLRHEFS
jgi:hypothetical protein